MRDSASPAPLIFPNSADTSRGTNQSGVKLYNKSLVLSLVRRYGSLSKTEIGRRTGLSTQTSSVIMKQLEDDGLLIRKEPMRGKVGQPSIPMSLNPEGAFSIGFKFGRRSAELASLGWFGAVILIGLRVGCHWSSTHSIRTFS
jgi:predicted transcriptional regulator